MAGESFSKCTLLSLPSRCWHFSDSTLMARWKHKLSNMACLDPKCASPICPLKSITHFLAHLYSLSSWHTVHQTLPDPRPLHKLFPLPGVTIAHFDEFSAHLPLPQRSFPWPFRWDHALNFIHSLCFGSPCHCIYDSCSLSSLREYFLDFCLPLSDIWVQNHVWFLLTIESLVLWKIMRYLKN